MMHITEDTPPDMLVGAMDLTVHLPTGRSVKMSVDRSTPMMDLLVQITNAQHLQLSGYIIEALGMAPSADRGDKILPYKPNTPIGALDTQHVRVVPKGRTLPVPKNVPPGHQPFESTFRLKVHLPRNQLYVCRVSRHVRLEEIMKKVCEEKNLDPAKYEFRHPGNLDEVLDYKLTLSDYQITEIYVVTRGTVSLTQTFTSSDIMALRKEEERKQMAAKTGGGVFNLIFKRGKTNRTSGSLSSENRSISPTRSDDSRSITPPQQIVTPPPPDLPEKPKPPQRKRRPAPKPPQKPPETPPIEISNGSQSNGEMKKLENGLTICHSRNSSDSSGFHETSVLSENCTLPRRPKNACEDNLSRGQSLSNLHKMSVHSKSTSSLTQAGRKKRAAPLPPPLPVVRSSSSVSALEKPSPLVASHSIESEAPVEVSDRLVEPELDSLEPAGHYNRRPVETTFSEVETEKLGSAVAPAPPNEAVNVLTTLPPRPAPRIAHKPAPKPKPRHVVEPEMHDKAKETKDSPNETHIQPEDVKTELPFKEDEIAEVHSEEYVHQKMHTLELGPLDIHASDEPESKPPEVVAVVMKTPSPEVSFENKFDSFTRKRGFLIGSSMRSFTDDETGSVCSAVNEAFIENTATERYSSVVSLPQDNAEVLHDVDMEMFSASTSRNSKNSMFLLRHMQSVQEYEDRRPERLLSITSLQSVDSLPGFLSKGNMRKWANHQDLDEISIRSDKWVIGGEISTDSLSSALTLQTSTDSMTSLQPPSYTPSPPCSEISSLSGISQKAIEPRIVETKPTPETIVEKSEPKPPEPVTEASRTDSEKVDEEITDIDWQYQLPSPPKAFRDSSPPLPEVTRTDSVRASTQLFEKLSHVKDPEVETVTISDSTSNLSDEDKKMCNKLTLEHLEKRKTLVYNRELSTSLKMSDDDTKKNSVLNELESTIHNYVPKNVSRRNSHAQESRQSNNANIPNFVITTYDAPKKQINIFEDDSIHTNKDNGSKRSSFAESADTTDQSLRKHSFTSMENISYRKHSVGNQSDDGLFKKPLDVSKFKSKPLNGNFVTRSGSFSIDYDANNWKPVNPVKRSKSQLTVAKKEGQFKEEGMTKADSSFDVSGLQSLGVMRMIQTKLNTPTSSVENLHHEEKQPAKAEQESPAPPPKPEKSESKSYHYRGPPAINLSTWSERPKTQISLKDDTDYKIKTDVPKSKSTVDIFNKTTYNGNESICIKTDNNSNNVSIKINGAEPLVTQKIGNVVIKIGHSSETIYRKPLGNINGTERPHSVAFDSSFDISRVPIVRSVELKKPFKEPHMNRSVTQIYSSNEPPRTFSDYKNDKFTDNRRSSENLNERNFNKPVVRISSFATNTPVVRGFRNIENGKSNRNSWTPTSNTTPSSKPNVFKSEEVNKNGNYTDSYKDHPFGNVILRNTPNSINKRNSFGYSNSFSAEAANKNPPPPPPQLPKLNTFTKRPQKVVEPETDSRSELLSAIRNFGGKKGLKTVKM